MKPDDHLAPQIIEKARKIRNATVSKVGLKPSVSMDAAVIAASILHAGEEIATAAQKSAKAR